MEAASPQRLIARGMQDSELSARLRWRALRVIAAGKASPFMAMAFADVLGGNIRECVVIGTHRLGELPLQFVWQPSGHPLPDERSMAAGRRALEVAGRTTEAEALVVLLSGGASALMAVPAGTLTLNDKRTAVDVLLKAGADITTLNTVRKHLSAVKGGRLACAAAGPTVCLAISDVVGDDLSVIGSGPTVPDPSTYADALRCVERLGVSSQLPPAVIEYLQDGLRGRIAETPKPGDACLERSITRVIGGRMIAMAGAREAARALRYEVVVIDEPVVGEARVAGPALLERARLVAGARPRPACVIASGETTVNVTGKGKGGRNQEMALSVARMLGDAAGDDAFASIGTDGVDGPTDAAGAFSHTTTLARAAQQGLDAAAHLTDNNAYGFFDRLDDLIITGPTTTNVGDLQVVLFR